MPAVENKTTAKTRGLALLMTGVLHGVRIRFPTHPISEPAPYGLHLTSPNSLRVKVSAALPACAALPYLPVLSVGLRPARAGRRPTLPTANLPCRTGEPHPPSRCSVPR